MNSVSQSQKSVVGHLIDGRIIGGAGSSLNVFNPATGKVLREVCVATAAEVDAAVGAAQRAFPSWAATSAIKRARVMFRFKQNLERYASDLARLVSEEHGKIHADALGEVRRGIENVEYACGAPDLLKGEHTRSVATGVDSWSEMHPLGVVAGITPFNFPVMVPLWMYPLAIACGNTFVLKPSERDPSSALFAAQLAHDAGLPNGVLTVLNGDALTVDALLADERIKAVSFVGSTPIAKKIYTTGATNGKRVQALGGAKNHAVVMPDSDLPQVVSALMGAAYGSAGERCMAISVVVAVGDEVADKLVKQLKLAVQSVRVAPGDDPGSDMGPLITAEHRARVAAYIEKGVSEGARLVMDGRQLAPPDDGSGFFLGPTLFDDVRQDMAVYEDEIFGPVLCVVRVNSLAEAITLIDCHQYGNGACIFTADGGAARYFSDRIEVGMVGINVPLPVPVSYHSFGGWKASCFGDLSAHGPDGVRFYTRRKTITQRWWGCRKPESAQFSFPNS